MALTHNDSGNFVDAWVKLKVNPQSPNVFTKGLTHPEAFNHFTNHPDWTRRKLALARRGENIEQEEGGGIAIFRNAVDYFR